MARHKLETTIEQGIGDLLKPRKKDEPPLTDVDRADREEKIKVLGLGIKYLAVRARLEGDDWGGNLNGGDGNA